jgi:predicted RNA-binding Zn-ribbon protein involved in translation (DUF1610 family)
MFLSIEWILTVWRYEWLVGQDSFNRQEHLPTCTSVQHNLTTAKVTDQPFVPSNGQDSFNRQEHLPTCTSVQHNLTTDKVTDQQLVPSNGQDSFIRQGRCSCLLNESWPFEGTSGWSITLSVVRLYCTDVHVGRCSCLMNESWPFEGTSCWSVTLSVVRLCCTGTI